MDAQIAPRAEDNFLRQNVLHGEGDGTRTHNHQIDSLVL